MNKKIVIYVVLGLIVLGLFIVTVFPDVVLAFKDTGKSREDLCKPEPGYTGESWREHMSHHPSIYRKCL